MKHCERCGRAHTGICGIPAGVVLGFGAHIGGISRAKASPFLSHSRPEVKMKGTPVLEVLLTQTQAELVKVMAMLREVPPEMEEYTLLLDREGKLNYIIKQLHQQIGVARSIGKLRDR